MVIELSFQVSVACLLLVFCFVLGCCALRLYVRLFLLFCGDVVVEASTTKVSSKGQVVIPANIRRAAGLKKGEKILAIAIDDTVVLKKIVDETFKETLTPLWRRVRSLGLIEEDINALVEEARAKTSP